MDNNKETKLQEMIKRIQTTHARDSLTDWERGFTDSLIGQLNKSRNLSDRQVEVFERIEYKYSPQALEKAQDWVNEYNEEKRKKVRIAAEYYDATGDYYRKIVNQVLNEPDFVLSEKQYRAMVENKYVAKVFAAIESEPKYPVGSLVDVRSTCGDYRAKHALSGQPAMVLSTNETVVSAAKGAKRYKLLPIGSSKMVYTEERWLKKVKKS